LAYLIFIIAWALLGASLWFGSRVQSACVAYYWAAGQYRDAIMDAVRNDGRAQLANLRYALVALGVWLVIYLFWWIFRMLPKEEPSK